MLRNNSLKELEISTTVKGTYNEVQIQISNGKPTGRYPE